LDEGLHTPVHYLGFDGSTVFGSCYLVRLAGLRDVELIRAAIERG
jgi:hypothetical protein